MDALMDFVTNAALPWQGVSALLLDVAVKGIFVLLAASVLVLCLRNASAAARHLVWSVAVSALLVLPAVSVVAPKWTVPGVPEFSLGVRGETAVEFAVSRGAGPDGVAVEAVTDARTAPASQAPDQHSLALSAPHRPTEAGATRSAAVRAELQAPAAQLHLEVAESASAASAAARGGINWMTPVLVAWFAGMLILLTWIVGGLARSWLLVRSAPQVTQGPLSWMFDELSEELDLRGRVTLHRSRGAIMPMACGIRPRILLPVDADDWTDDRLRAVILHELAHVRRRDYATQLVARVVGAIYWFNPLVWVAIHRMRVERELACDDQVLSTGSRASDYAGHLLEIARVSSGRRFVAYGGVAMARRSRLSDRLLAVLDGTRRRATVTPRMTITAWMGAACFLLPVAGAGLGTGSNPDLLAEERIAGTDGIVQAADNSNPSPTPQSQLTPAADRKPTASLVTAAMRTVASFRGMPAPPALTEGPVEPTQSRCDWYARDANTSHWVNGEDDDYQIRITLDGCRLDIEAAGEIVFNDEETDIVGISRRGYFEMEERDGRALRKIVIEPGGGGELQRRWFVDGDERQYDDEASAWLTEMIPLLFRRVGLQAEERAARILRLEGVDGVLQEITNIRSDYVARKYYQVLLADTDLDANQLRSIVRQAGSELESDYELAELLVEVAENHPVDESVMVVYVEAAGSLESDYEQRRVLDAILRRRDLSPDVAEAMLRLATDLDSDYELAELLIAILSRQPVDEVLTSEFFDAVHTLESDYEHTRVLKYALHQGAPNVEVLNLALESAENIDSDYERAELLLEVAGLYPVGENMPPSYLTAARSLDSDYELGRVLKSLIETQRLNEEALEIVLDAALTMESDYELAGLLLEIMERYDLNEAERAIYFEAVGSIESDYELGRVLKAIVEQGPLTEQNLRDILATAREMNSDYEVANVLIMVAENHDLEGELRTIFMEAADNISSDYERGRVLSALNPRGRRG